MVLGCGSSRTWGIPFGANFVPVVEVAQRVETFCNEIRLLEADDDWAKMDVISA